MIPAARQHKILSWLMQSGHLSTNDLRLRLNVSPMTIWRDLNILEEGGFVRRVRGGVEYVSPDVNPDPKSSAFNFPKQSGYPQPIVDPHKEAIGRYVAQEILSPGDDIILEGGTTVASMIPFIDQPNITLLTNGLNTLTLAQAAGTIETVLCCGGVLNQNTQCFIGPRAERFFYSYLADKVFVSASGYISNEGFFDPNPLYDSMKKTICSRARTTILLLDSGKFERSGLAKVLDFNEIHLMVTDWDAPQGIVEQVRSQGVDLRVVPKP